jgi:hypothetical protein
MEINMSTTFICVKGSSDKYAALINVNHIQCIVPDDKITGMTADGDNRRIYRLLVKIAGADTSLVVAFAEKEERDALHDKLIIKLSSPL